MDDMVSRKAAIDVLHGYFDGMLETDTWSPCVVYGLIEILPSVQPDMSGNMIGTHNSLDCISRQAAIDAVLLGITYAKAINKSTGEVTELFQESNKELTKAADRIKELPSAQPVAKDINVPCTDTISRQAAIDAVNGMLDCPNGYSDTYDKAQIVAVLEDVPSVQPEDWMERNKERILQAGMEGREIEFRIGGRLFAIREKAQ